MGGPARRAPSFDELYAEIERLPEGMTGEILEDGAIRAMSRPGKRHRRAALACLDALSGANANLRGVGWWIEVEAELRLRCASRCRISPAGGSSAYPSCPMRTR